MGWNSGYQRKREIDLLSSTAGVRCLLFATGDFLSPFYPRWYLVIESVASLVLWWPILFPRTSNQLFGGSEWTQLWGFHSMPYLKIWVAPPTSSRLASWIWREMYSLSRRPYFPKFHGNDLPRLGPIQGTKAAPGRLNMLDHEGFSNSSYSIRITWGDFWKCNYWSLTLELLIQCLGGMSWHLYI